MPNRHKRILIYSHDSFGLGHLRRCRAIAHALVQHDPKISVLILSGSPIIGNFEFRDRVDFVRLPGVVKLKNGEYVALKLPMDIEETVALRAAIIFHTAAAFDPDVFIVDKEPHGLRGEVLETLHMLKERGTVLVLGLRDILDDPHLLGPEWRNKNVLPTLDNLYDELWVYGLPQICDPLDGLNVPQSVHRKTVYTGYLRRKVGEGVAAAVDFPYLDRPYILVTAGGGGDGEAMLDWVLRAYENDPDLPVPGFFVFGPFLDADLQASFNARIAKLPNVDSITFDTQPEALIDNATAIVAMGGYNTFCEILSFNKRALIVPRTQPRLEQFIRASRSQEFGLVKMLVHDAIHDLDALAPDWRLMATALRQLPQQGRPSEVVLPGLLDGLDNVNRLADIAIARRERPGNIDGDRSAAAGDASQRST
ncbi:MAG: putative glycosyltransferase [Alphaproteobacteria bacterium]|jgi:predicted glycosyltransferase